MSIVICALRSRCCVALTVLLLAGGCVNPVPEPQESPSVNKVKSSAIDYSNTGSEVTQTKALEVDVVIVNAARDMTLIGEVLSGVNDIYQQCQITMQFDTKKTTLTPEQLINSNVRSTLAQQYKKTSPTIFIVPRTSEADVAFAHLPSLNSPAASTIWITERVNERCLSWITAHELGHVLLNSGKHSNGRVNVMSTGCTVSNWNNNAATPRWTTAQCTALHQSPFFVR